MLALAVLTMTGRAQTELAGGNRKAVNYSIDLSGCNYASYFIVHDYLEHIGATRLTATPKGYEPFYISTYARHGSRWLGESWQYDNPIKLLREGQEKGKLTEQGKVLLDELTHVRELCPDSKLGVLTEIGAEQHRDLAQRMVRNFPEIFNSEGDFFAQSSTVKRCVLSMNAEIEVIQPHVGKKITQAYGRKGMQNRLAGHYETKAMEAKRSPGYSIHNKERQQLTPYKRLAAMLFTDTEWTTVKDLQSLSRTLYGIAQNMQSHNFDISLWKYFNNEELHALWTVNNRHWYRMFGPSPTTGGVSPLRSKWQLEDIIEGADTIVSLRDWHGGNLRFGHDTSLMPLVCLMELGTTGRQVSEDKIETIDTFWRNQEIFPMAANIQLIFYRPLNGNGDVLVKALLNEREVTLPGKAVAGPYYRWSEIREHWVQKMKTLEK